MLFIHINDLISSTFCLFILLLIVVRGLGRIGITAFGIAKALFIVMLNGLTVFIC